MASATGIPEERASALPGGVENEPLLGEPGTVTQREGQSIFTNLITGRSTTGSGGRGQAAGGGWNADSALLGTASLAQVGILIVSRHPPSTYTYESTVCVYKTDRLTRMLPSSGLASSLTTSSSSRRTR